jgi:glutathione S-transferase
MQIVTEVELWHMKVSNFNEKARWALDYKGVPHVRHDVEPGRHVGIAKRIAGTRTMPIAKIDGKIVADSTEIIRELEARWPEPPLYPAGDADRARALELEDFFDEELGPYTRTLVVAHGLPEPDVLLGAFFPDMTGARRKAAELAYPLVKKRFRSTIGVTPASVEEAFDKVRASARRAMAELQPSGYLVGDGFSVADLTAAALVAPAVAPPEFPYPQPQRDHPLLAPVRAAFAESGMEEWVRTMYARHRGSARIS